MLVLAAITAGVFAVWFGLATAAWNSWDRRASRQLVGLAQGTSGRAWLCAGSVVFAVLMVAAAGVTLSLGLMAASAPALPEWLASLIAWTFLLGVGEAVLVPFLGYRPKPVPSIRVPLATDGAAVAPPR